MPDQPKNGLSRLVEVWPLVMFLGTLTVGATLLWYQQAAADENIRAIKADMASMRAVQTDINLQILKLSITLEQIKERQAQQDAPRRR